MNMLSKNMQLYIFIEYLKAVLVFKKASEY